MGLCVSNSMTAEEKANRKQERVVSKAIDKQVQADHRDDEEIYKLLLLGAGESGKSTLFKQMMTLYGPGYNDAARRGYLAPIHNNIITSMQSLILAVPRFGAPVYCTASLEYIRDIAGEAPVNLDVAEHIKALWADKGIQKAYENRANFHLMDSAAYFFDKVTEVATPDYLPSMQDVLRVRVRTTGIVEHDFQIENHRFKIVDVGGQRNERKKWIHCFENLTAVLFIGVLSEYDLVLYEDSTMNRMEETLNIFDEICNSQWFSKTSIILFLNKSDLFEEKIKIVPLQKCPLFADYTGEQTFDAGCALIERKFQEKNKVPDKMIYTHVTCATDTGSMKVVLSVVKDIVVRAAVRGAGFV